MIVYFSNSSGFTDRFIRKLDVPAMRIPLMTKEASAFEVSEEFVLITPTYGANGRDFVPKQVIKFLNNSKNRDLLRGVIGTGNRNFGEDYLRGAYEVARKCCVPFLYGLELDGTEEDTTRVREGLRRFGAKDRLDH